MKKENVKNFLQMLKKWGTLTDLKLNLLLIDLDKKQILNKSGLSEKCFKITDEEIEKLTKIMSKITFDDIHEVEVIEENEERLFREAVDFHFDNPDTKFNHKRCNNIYIN